MVLPTRGEKDRLKRLERLFRRNLQTMQTFQTFFRALCTCESSGACICPARNQSLRGAMLERVVADSDQAKASSPGSSSHGAVHQ
jgi:hypothetical protein